jgi:hypothetical protein
VDEGPVELTRSERRVLAIGLIAGAGGQIPLRVLGNITGIWWPAFALLALFIAFVVAFTVWIARSRRRSITSLAALVLPDRLRRRSSRR